VLPLHQTAGKSLGISSKLMSIYLDYERWLLGCVQREERTVTFGGRCFQRHSPHCTKPLLATALFALYQVVACNGTVRTVPSRCLQRHCLHCTKPLLPTALPTLYQPYRFCFSILDYNVIYLLSFVTIVMRAVHSLLVRKNVSNLIY
jgi:hypothetical protein